MSGIAMKYYLIFLYNLFLFACVAQPYANAIFTQDIKTLEVNKEGQWNANPVIVLHSDEKIQVSFDQLSHNYRRYAYRLVHCNADWTRSELNELEYMDGFSQNDIEKYYLSENTWTDYTHYVFEVPNEQLQLKLSGNYALIITDKDRQDEVQACACFSVLDRRIHIEASVSSSTDLGYNTSYQQVNFVLNTAANQIERPESDLKILVRQNRRTDNEVFGVQALMTSSNQIQYEHLPELIFDGGNEYRRFEITTYKLSGLGVDRVRFERPFYHAYLLESGFRDHGYTYDKDQNGRFYIRNLQAEYDQQTEADYFWVYFSLAVPEQYTNGCFYLFGDLTNGAFDEQYKMTYNAEKGCFGNKLFLKQGAYNYQYLYFSGPEQEKGKDQKSGKRYSSLPAEGNYWETENEYQIFVYYRPIGAQYDALIAYTEFQSHP